MMKKLIVALLFIGSLISCNQSKDKPENTVTNGVAADTIVSESATESKKDQKDYMPSSIYEACGWLNLSKEEINVQTYLPDQFNEKYLYLKYYNISSDKCFGVIGILDVDGVTDYDLHKATGAAKLLPVSGGKVKFTDVDSTFSTVSLSKIKEGDRFVFICFHEGDFFKTLPWNDQKKILQTYRDKICDGDDFEKIFRGDLKENVQKSYDQKKIKPALMQPQIGDGGILTYSDAQSCR